ncbi:hypothetical protein CRENBAI_013476, partial [Crenichthys baileyi]
MRLPSSYLHFGPTTNTNVTVGTSQYQDQADKCKERKKWVTQQEEELRMIYGEEVEILPSPLLIQEMEGARGRQPTPVSPVFIPGRIHSSLPPTVSTTSISSRRRSHRCKPSSSPTASELSTLTATSSGPFTPAAASVESSTSAATPELTEFPAGFGSRPGWRRSRRAVVFGEVRTDASYPSTEGPSVMVSWQLLSPELVGGHPAPSAGHQSPVRPPVSTWVQASLDVMRAECMKPLKQLRGPRILGQSQSQPSFRTHSPQSSFMSPSMQPSHMSLSPEFVSFLRGPRTDRLSPEFVSFLRGPRTDRLSPEFVSFLRGPRSDRLRPEFLSFLRGRLPPRPGPEHLIGFLWGVLMELLPDSRPDTPQPDPKSASIGSTRRRGRCKRGASAQFIEGLGDASAHATEGLGDASATPQLLRTPLRVSATPLRRLSSWSRRRLCDASAPAHATEGLGDASDDASAPAHATEGLGDASATPQLLRTPLRVSATPLRRLSSSPAHATEGLGDASATPQLLRTPLRVSATPLPRLSSSPAHATEGLGDASAPAPVSEGPADASAPAPVSEGPADASAPAPVSEGPADASAPAPVSEGPADASAPAPVSEGPADASAPAPVSEGPADASAPAPVSEGPADASAPAPVSEGPADASAPAPVTPAPVSEGPADASAPAPVSEGPADASAPAPVSEGPADASAPAPVSEGPADASAPAPVSEGPADASAPAPVSEGPPDASAPAPVSEGPADASAPAPVSEGPADASAPAPVSEGPADASAPAPVSEGPADASAPAPVSEGPADALAPSLQAFQGFSEKLVLVLASEPRDEGFEEEVLPDLVPEGFKEQFVLVLPFLQAAVVIRAHSGVNLVRHKRNWIPPPKSMKENVDYTQQESIAKTEQALLLSGQGPTFS